MHRPKLRLRLCPLVSILYSFGHSSADAKRSHGLLSTADSPAISPRPHYHQIPILLRAERDHIWRDNRYHAYPPRDSTIRTED